MRDVGQQVEGLKPGRELETALSEGEEKQELPGMSSYRCLFWPSYLGVPSIVLELNTALPAMSTYFKKCWIGEKNLC